MVSFPPTGGPGKIGSVSVMLSLAKGSANTITFSNANGRAPGFDAVVIQEIAGSNDSGGYNLRFTFSLKVASPQDPSELMSKKTLKRRH